MIAPFDTSGKVATPDGFYTTWGDLSPFTQGYIEAIFDFIERGAFVAGWPRTGLSDLAPETLARIIADCDVGVDLPFMLGRAYNRNEAGGRSFWKDRQTPGVLRDFKPLTVQLGEDGKVRFGQ